MKSFLLCLLIGCSLHAAAQIKYERTALITGAFFDPYSHTSDSMVFPRNRNKLSFGDEVNIDLQSFFSLRNERLRLSAGVGFSQRHFSMSKFNAGDFILLFIPFATYKDTAYLTKVRSSSQYINVPLGFEYRLSNSDNRTVTLFAGLRLINSFKIAATTVATPDTNYFRPNSTQLSAINNSYNNDINSYLLRIEPYLDMDIHFAKGYGMRLGLFPISFYVTPWSKKITQTATAIGVNFSLYKKIMAKK
ncbi:hypothetical protein [Ferruginibacter sp. SUN106]|uniref:hypothetical protein n=1 Tax=Ferruginibacter sp. SUN106 TaxID=2978348 RepID=UPI003D36ACB4